jgi:hypothetical protein
MRVTDLPPEAVGALSTFGRVQLDGDRLTIDPIETARVPDLVAAVVAAGGRVHDVDAGRGSLEDRFVALVTGGAPDEPPQPSLPPGSES